MYKIISFFILFFLIFIPFCRVSAVDTTPSFDLAVNDIILTAGHSIITLYVKNNSSNQITQSFEYKAEGIGSTTDGVKLKDISTGTNSDIEISLRNLQYQPLKNGYYAIKVTLDPDNKIAETNEDNNVFEKSIKVDDSKYTNLYTVSDINISSIGDKQALINWKTSLDSFCKVRYGKLPDLENTQTSSLGTQTLQLSNLDPEANYYYKVVCDDPYWDNDIRHEFMTLPLQPVATSTPEIIPGTEANQSSTSENNQASTSSPVLSNEKLPDKIPADIAEMNKSANLLFNNQLIDILINLKILHNETKEQLNEIKYLKPLTSDLKGYNKNIKQALNIFITYGADQSTKILGDGERAAVVYSYKSAFNKLPKIEVELADMIKIANGRFPSEINNSAEKRAKVQFLKIYKRNPDMNNSKDTAAVKVMAYGLRQKAGNRNLKSEKSGINTFKNIYGHDPKTTEEWNIMQAITYSGAKR